MSWLRLPVFFLLTAVTSAAFAQSAYDSVDPVIGTSGDGNTIPGASLPFDKRDLRTFTGRMDLIIKELGSRAADTVKPKEIDD